MTQLVGLSLEGDLAILEHDKHGLGLAVRSGRDELHPAACRHRLMGGDVERVSQLVRDDDGRHVIEVAKLDDLRVDRERGDRIETGRRFVVKHDFGVEGQGNWADFSGSNVSLLFSPDFNRSRVDSFGLITGQVGYAWNNVLLYVKGGAAVTGDRYDAFSGTTGLALASTSDTRWGGTVGAGLEFGFAPNWSMGVEYDHLFMGTRNVNFNDPTGAFFQTESISQDVDIGLVRLNYRFGGWGAPVTAHY